MILTVENYRDVGAFLGGRRQMMGLEQKQLAELAGVSKACISALEIGTSAGRLSSLVIIADALGMEVEVREKTGRKE